MKEPQHAPFPMEYTQKVSFSSYQDRLQTFALCQNDRVSSVELASAGFCYNRDNQTIVCRKCKLALSADFDIDFNPLSYHNAHSKGACPYLVKRFRKKSKTATAKKQHALAQSEASANTNDSIKLQNNSELLQLTVNNCASTSSQLSEPDDIETAYSTSLKSIVQECVEELSEMTTFPLSDMRYEVARLSSFRNAKFPDETKASTLANQGLFVKATEEGNILRCTFCPFQHNSIDTSAKQIFTLHSRDPAQCPHIRGKKTPDHIRNIPDVYSKDFIGNDQQPSSYIGLGIHEEKAECPEFAVDQRRLSTFLSYPNYSSDSKKLAEAGYYYKGGESVCCFWCGCTSGDWKVEEDPWVRHARTSPTCRFVILQKGQDFINAAFELHGRYTTPQPTKKPLSQKITERKVRPKMQTNAAQKALRMGLDRALVRTVIEDRIREEKQDFSCSADIVREVQELAKRRQRSVSPQLVLPTPTHYPELSDDQMEITEHAEGVETAGGEELAPENTEESDIDDSETQSGNTTEQAPEPTTRGAPEMSREEITSLAMQLKMQFTCKICLSDVVGIAYLPCGHLVCCVSCSASLSQCPLCRDDIKGTVRVMLPTH